MPDLKSYSLLSAMAAADKKWPLLGLIEQKIPNSVVASLFAALHTEIVHSI